MTVIFSCEARQFTLVGLLSTQEFKFTGKLSVKPVFFCSLGKGMG